MKSEIPFKNISNFLKIDNPGDAILSRKQYIAKSLDIGPDEERTLVATISTTDVDSDGDIVWGPGADITRFSSNPILCFDHTYSIPPIGKVIDLQISPTGILAKMQMATSQMATEMWDLIKGGFLKCCSIGFIATEVLIAGTQKFKDFAKEHNLNVEGCKRIISKFELIENSMVSLPANQECLVMAYANKSLHLSDSMAKSLGLEVKSEEVKVEPKVEEPVLNVKIEPVVVKEPEVVKVEDQPVVIEQSKSEPIPIMLEPPKKIWNILREGPYICSEDDKSKAKSLRSGKII